MYNTDNANEEYDTWCFDDPKPVDKDPNKDDSNKEIDDDEDDNEELMTEEDDESLDQADEEIQREAKKYDYLRTPEQWEAIVRGLNAEKDSLEQKAAATEIYNCLGAFINSFLQRYYPTYSKEWEDMFQECFISVQNTMKKYIPGRGVPTTWIWNPIKGACRSYLDGLNESTPHYQKQNKLVIQEIEKKKALGLSIDAPSISLSTGYSNSAVNRSLESISRQHNSVSIDQKKGNSEFKIGDSLISSIDGPEEAYQKKERQEYIQSIIDIMPKNIKAVIMLKYGLDDRYPIIGKNDMSNQKISKILNIPVQNIERMVAQGNRIFAQQVTAEGAFKEDRRQRSHVCRPSVIRPKVEDFYIDMASFDFSSI